jgi:hypothetical protein
MLKIRMSFLPGIVRVSIPVRHEILTFNYSCVYYSSVHIIRSFDNAR